MRKLFDLLVLLCRVEPFSPKIPFRIAAVVHLTMLAHSFVRAEAIDPVQVRMARNGLALSVRELARLSGVNKATIVRTEAGLPVRPRTLGYILEALEEAGAEFLACHETGKVAVSVAV